MKAPEGLPRPKPPVTGTAPLPRTPSSAELAAVGAPARRVAAGAKVDLTVSGLAPEDRDRWQRADSRPCARTCRLQEQPAAGRGRRTLDLLQACRNDFSSDEREYACKPLVFLEAAGDRRNASPASVRQDADEQGDCSNKKDLHCRPFAKRLKGFEPSTFCMASSTRASRPVPNNPANKPFSAPTAACCKARHSPGNHGGFRTETGPSLALPIPRNSRKRR
jgi:hypothetical protein